MKTDKLKAMIKRTLDTYNINIPDEHVDQILDLCDDNYEEELNKEKARHIRAEKVFIIALGKQRFYEIKESMKND